MAKGTASPEHSSEEESHAQGSGKPPHITQHIGAEHIDMFADSNSSTLIEHMRRFDDVD